MALRKASIPSRGLSAGRSGFTLIEILIGLALLAVVGSLSLALGAEELRGSSYRDDRNTFVDELYQARGQAMHSVCLAASCSAALAHGVHVETSGITVFEGSPYNPADPTNQSFTLRGSVSLGGPADIIFAPQSGEVSAPAQITVADAFNHASVVSVASDGQITWTH